MTARALLCALALTSLLSGCKQGRGDVCQVDDDCEAPLTCNAGTRQCQPPGSVSADAAVPADAALPPDASIPDAAVVVPDAAPVPDAAAR
jgi:hypothetical protein